MNSQDIARIIYEQSDKKISLKDVNLILDKQSDVIKDALSKNESVEISGLTGSSLMKFNSLCVKSVMKWSILILGMC